MPSVEVELCPLAERKQTAWKRRLALDTNQRFGADELAGRSEQRVASLNSVHLHAFDPVDRSLEDKGIDDLDAASIRTKALVANDQ